MDRKKLMIRKLKEAIEEVENMKDNIEPCVLVMQYFLETEDFQTDIHCTEMGVKN